MQDDCCPEMFVTPLSQPVQPFPVATGIDRFKQAEQLVSSSRIGPVNPFKDQFGGLFWEGSDQQPRKRNGDFRMVIVESLDNLFEHHLACASELCIQVFIRQIELLPECLEQGCFVGPVHSPVEVQIHQGGGEAG